MQALANLTPLLVFAVSLAFFALGKSRASSVAAGNLSSLHSRPNYHGTYAFLWAVIAGLVLYVAILVLGNWFITSTLIGAIRGAEPEMEMIRAQLVLSDAKAIARGTVASADDPLRQEIASRFTGLSSVHLTSLILVPVLGAVLAGFLQIRNIGLEWRARNKSEQIIRSVLFVCAALAVLTTVGIVLSLIFETMKFFGNIDWRIDKYLFGTEWSPLAGVHSGEMDPDRVGAVPLFVGTILITLIAMCVSVPIGLMSAIYLSDFASKRVRSIVKPMLELLAGIPTVVYGFFAAITIAPLIRGWGEGLGLSVASESALAAGVVMGIMIIPFISSLSDDVINSVPQALRDGSYGLGATQAETIRQVVLPAALPGIVSAVLLGVSRAIGETMIVVMAAGQGANLTVNPLEAVTTVTVQIVMLITGDTEAETAAGPAFTLGFTLFCVTLVLNIVALRTVRKYRELYD